MARTTGYRATGGKQPSLRPSATLAPRASKVTRPARKTGQLSKTAPKAVRASEQTTTSTPRRQAPAGGHRPFTRSRSKIFRLLDLPAELRELIYTHLAAAYSPVDLATFRIPDEFTLVSKQVRGEALPIFFGAGRFRAEVVGNYCVFSRHFHGRGFVGYGEAGALTLSPVLKGAGSEEEGEADEADEEDEGMEGMEGMEDMEHGKDDGKDDGKQPPLTQFDPTAVRFKHVTLSVSCICCTPPKPIANLTLTSVNSQATVECKLLLKPRQADKTTRPSMELVFKQVRKVVARLGGRKGFNGFTVADVVEVGKAVKYEGKAVTEAREEDEDEGWGEH